MADMPIFDEQARAAIWYFLESTFGAVGYEATMGEPYWSHEWEVFEERARKRLGLFKLVNRSEPPLAVKSFIKGPAGTQQLLGLLEIVPGVVFETSVDEVGKVT